MSETERAIRKNVPLTLVLFVVMFVSAWPNAEKRLAEARWYRDFTGLTPFVRVKTTYSNPTKEGQIVGGVMQKIRCDFVKHSQVAYLYFEDKPRRRTSVDTTPEDELTGVSGQSRPPSDDLEQWGPWIIRWRGDTPVSWEIFVDHEKCPTPPKDQTNKFASGPWSAVAPKEE